MNIEIGVEYIPKDIQDKYGALKILGFFPMLDLCVVEYINTKKQDLITTYYLKNNYIKMGSVSASITPPKVDIASEEAKALNASALQNLSSGVGVLKEIFDPNAKPIFTKQCSHTWVTYQPLFGESYECCSKCPERK